MSMSINDFFSNEHGHDDLDWMLQGLYSQTHEPRICSSLTYDIAFDLGLYQMQTVQYEHELYDLTLEKIPL